MKLILIPLLLLLVSCTQTEAEIQYKYYWQEIQIGGVGPNLYEVDLTDAKCFYSGRGQTSISCIPKFVTK